MIDLEAIRQRNERCKQHAASCQIHGCDGEHSIYSYADIDALLVEVERLRTKFCCQFCGGEIDWTQHHAHHFALVE